MKTRTKPLRGTGRANETARTAVAAKTILADVNIILASGDVEAIKVLGLAARAVCTHLRPVAAA